MNCGARSFKSCSLSETLQALGKFHRPVRMSLHLKSDASQKPRRLFSFQPIPFKIQDCVLCKYCLPLCQVMDAAWRKAAVGSLPAVISTSKIGREFRDNQSTKWFIFDSPISFLINNFSQQERRLQHRNQIPDKCPGTAADKQDLWAQGSRPSNRGQRLLTEMYSRACWGPSLQYRGWPPKSSQSCSWVERLKPFGKL